VGKIIGVDEGGYYDDSEYVSDKEALAQGFPVPHPDFPNTKMA
jgi:hypothetical protein